MKHDERKEGLLDWLITRQLKSSKPDASLGPCPDENLFAAYFEKELSKRESAAIDGHLSACVKCRTEMANLIKLAASESPEPVPQRSLSFSTIFSFLKWRPLHAMAAAGLVIVMLIGLYQFSERGFLSSLKRPAERLEDMRERPSSSTPKGETSLKPTPDKPGGEEARTEKKSVPKSPAAEIASATGTLPAQKTERFASKRARQNSPLALESGSSEGRRGPREKSEQAKQSDQDLGKNKELMARKMQGHPAVGGAPSPETQLPLAGSHGVPLASAQEKGAGVLGTGTPLGKPSESETGEKSETKDAQRRDAQILADRTEFPKPVPPSVRRSIVLKSDRTKEQILTFLAANKIPLHETRRQRFSDTQANANRAALIKFKDSDQMFIKGRRFYYFGELLVDEELLANQSFPLLKFTVNTEPFNRLIKQEPELKEYAEYPGRILVVFHSTVYYFSKPANP